jgi:7-carboxy-7-deazaguanine synthase
MKLAELFYSIQGEGKLVGVPSVFVRASGCNLRCVWCDTPYASWNPEGTDFSIAQIIEQIEQYKCRHVVLTGGEPTIMPDYSILCETLTKKNYHVTVETAATVFAPAPVDLASISPKLSNSTPPTRFTESHERQRLNIPVIQRWIDTAEDFQLKFVVSSPADMDEIQSILSQVNGWGGDDVLLMPEGTDVATLESRAGWLSEICKQTGYRYCPRLHISLYGNRRGV